MSDQPGLPFGASSAIDRPPADEAARTRIRTELDRSMLVEAGAGSGKTHEMATRMAAGIASGKDQIEHMAAVTFTRKAAAELRGRFQLALEAELAGAQDAARKARLQHALSNIERFFAGTIHAFCARLLRERPVEAGVAPGFTELDDAEEMMVRRQSWRDYRAQAKAAGDTDLLALLDAGVQPKHLDAAFDVVCQYEDVEFPPGDAQAPDGKAAWNELAKFWEELQKLLPPQIDPDTTCKLQKQVEKFARAWKFATSNGKDDAGLVELLELWQSKPGVTQNRWPTRPIAKQAEALWEAFRTATVMPYLTQWRQYVYRLTVTILDKARREAKKERLRRNALTFNDLLLMTADVLRRDATVRRSLQQKYRWLFVDEFQDTDPVQAEIMFLLAPDDRPGALFVVGDPKQSIYRFRRADIDIYNEVRDRLSRPDGSGLLKLTTNFRSVPGLCNWANGVFKNLFPPAHTPLSPMFAPLDSHREARGSAPSLATLTTDSEPEAIARYIRSEVDSGRRKFGDFLILTRKKKGLQPYARALEALQVPIEVTGAGAFGESEEVRHLALLLEALADPQDAVALVGVLRGPLFGVSDRDLFAFRQAGGYFNLFSEPGDPAEAPEGAKADGKSRVTSALVSLRRWYRWTRMLPVGAALERIVEDSGMLALVAATPDGVEAGDLLHAIDRVRAIVEGGFTLADAADALASWSGLDPDGVKESTEVDSLPLQPGRPEVVRLMNLHKAKGLEADVVFLADPDGGYPSTVDVRIERKPGAAAEGFFRIVQKSEQGWVVKVLGEPAGWDGYAATEQGYLDAEVHRLMYVAATRARDLLVIGRSPGGSGKSAAWPAFEPYLVGVPELIVPASVTMPPVATVDLSDAALNKVVESSAAAHARAQSASWAAVSVTSESKAFPRMTPGTDDDAGSSADDPTRIVSADTPSRRADAGVAWGTLVHGLLEHAMRHPAATRDDLRRLAMWLTMEEPQLRVVIEQALDTVESVSRADFWRTARASAEVHEEAPFAVREDRAGVSTVVSGVVDLVYRDGDRWRILDYKTDTGVEADELAKRYTVQLEAYRIAWQRVSGGSTGADVWAARQ